MKNRWQKKWAFTLFAVISLGLGACSDAALKDQRSLTSASLSQNNQTKVAGGVKTNVSDLSPFLEITYYDFYSAELSAETHMVLDRAVNKSSKNQSSRVIVSGHADERGTREYNLALGRFRASAVADYMVAKGIDEGY
jgi:outer membrane protein OmpA-like peptidoglycan-associated protein